MAAVFSASHWSTHFTEEEKPSLLPIMDYMFWPCLVQVLIPEPITRQEEWVSIAHPKNEVVMFSTKSMATSSL